jgi:hypothetical protein
MGQGKQGLLFCHVSLGILSSEEMHINRGRIIPFAKLATSCNACSLTLSSSDNGLSATGSRASFPLDLTGDLAAARVLTMGSRTPSPTHCSFFWMCPTISFFRARREAVCSGKVRALRSWAKIGGLCGRAMKMGVSKNSMESQGRGQGEGVGSIKMVVRGV